MNPITYFRPADASEALAHADVGARFIAGGTNLVDLMKEFVMRPAALIDINGLPLDAIAPGANGGLLLGATARNADTAYHPLVRTGYPLLTAALLAGASPQIRNMASNGGNLLQRTRCHYFYDVATQCNKRQPGSGCSAIGGLTRQHAILGASEHCIAVHPSDMCVALAALGAIVHVRSASGERQIDFADFHRLPGDQPERDTTLAAGELITHIELPPAAQFAAHSAYLKIRDRASYAFALVSVAAMLDIGDDGVVRDARLALGGVAHKPWRVPAAEALLVGHPATAEHFARAADALLAGAQGQGENDFKITLAHRAVVRALEQAAAGTHDNTGSNT
ncbi:xanthine dehydrogenase family protein subunit M [Pseudoduganella sp. FT25W]|jgi:xanthine dehydrogenase YagS FAD-binding subunit|uniref:Xanthine dehydrogenase family protein subunit M n=1 Tax=Duganella alba TaxID=2666081 RepID=A0A6L5QAF4_9BURK|nr:xanthine dehydrogenase family protein subunit M [Duganella alba]MRX06570.1 xanthine dehydrogenase family protein subunit M [Duganella alba]MRX14964.1 xanthine dehydrogenase family protein subunit M [Duganella alba]